MFPWSASVKSVQSVAYSSQNLFPERRQNQFRPEMCRLVLYIEDRIDFGDFERHHLAGIGDHFHREVRFAVIGASADGSSHSWRFIWIEEVRVKGHRESSRVFCDDG